MKYQSNIGLNENEIEERVANTITNGNLSFELDNNQSILVSKYNGQYPSILTKTNHIRLYARKSIDNTQVDSSSIRLIKESKDFI